MLLMMLKLSEYSEALPKLEKERYKQKAGEIKCNVDPYIDDSYNCGPVPVVSYTNIYDFLICSSIDLSCDGKPANAVKSLDSFRMVCAEGWVSTLQAKTWPDAVIISIWPCLGHLAMAISSILGSAMSKIKFQNQTLLLLWRVTCVKPLLKPL